MLDSVGHLIHIGKIIAESWILPDTEARANKL